MAFTSLLKRWKSALKMSIVEEQTESRVGLYGVATVVSSTILIPYVAVRICLRFNELTNHISSDVPMTPYDSLIWNIWLPKVRSCIK